MQGGFAIRSEKFYTCFVFALNDSIQVGRYLYLSNYTLWVKFNFIKITKAQWRHASSALQNLYSNSEQFKGVSLRFRV